MCMKRQNRLKENLHMFQRRLDKGKSLKKNPHISAKLGVGESTLKDVGGRQSRRILHSNCFAST